MLAMTTLSASPSTLAPRRGRTGYLGAHASIRLICVLYLLCALLLPMCPPLHGWHVALACPSAGHRAGVHGSIAAAFSSTMTDV
jgi:hypothetical protein